jgi:hypothetical protein
MQRTVLCHFEITKAITAVAVLRFCFSKPIQASLMAFSKQKRPMLCIDLLYLSVHEHLDLSNFLDGFKSIREYQKEKLTILIIAS